MKTFTLFMFAMFAVCGVALAQTATEVVQPSLSLDFSSFAGIMAVATSLVTQIMKLVPAINQNKIAKIGVSIAAGVSICFITWALQIATPLASYNWWQVLIYGAASGLSGCGFYDVVKAIGALFKK